MSRKRRSRSSGERFVLLPHWMLKCPAWCTMPPIPKVVLLHLWERHDGNNNGNIVYAVRDAREIGIGRSNAAVALAELIERGFLRVGRNSAFNVKAKKARTWALTAEKIDGESRHQRLHEVVAAAGTVRGAGL